MSRDPSSRLVVMATLCCHPSRRSLVASFSVKGGDASNAGVLRNTPTFLAVCKKCPRRFLYTRDAGDGPPGSTHSYPDWGAFPAALFLSAFEALVLRVPSLMDVCRNKAGKTGQDQECSERFHGCASTYSSLLFRTDESY